MSDFDSQIATLSSDDPRIQVGRFTYGSPRFMIWEELESITIGSFCSIADDVVIFAGGEHRLDWVTTYPLRIAFGDPLAGRDGHPATKGTTKIGNDVWIGFGATILSGVTIGDGAVIGARSVVTKDVAPYSVVGGNPAKQLRFRFSDAQITKLLAIEWWNWPIEQIHASQAALCGGDIDTFIRTYS